jgi:hypothetical protein
MITEFRRVELMTEEHGRINDLWGCGGLSRRRKRLWSGLRGSNPCPRLGKPLYYHCTKPASLVRLMSL